MYGIATTSTIGSNDSNSRFVLVEVTGAAHKQVHVSNYTVKIPFSRLSQTIQRIARTGGKVVNVTMPVLNISDNQNHQIDNAVEITAPEIETKMDTKVLSETSDRTDKVGKTAATKAKNSKSSKKPRG